MELENTEECILCHEPIIANINITGHPTITKMKVNIAQHRQCKKHYSQYMMLKLKQKVVENLLADKALEIECFLETKKLKSQ